MLCAGCLMAFARGGADAGRGPGVLGTKGPAGCTVMLVSTAGPGARELMKNMIKSAMTGMTMMSTNTVVLSRVKRK